MCFISGDQGQFLLQKFAIKNWNEAQLMKHDERFYQPHNQFLLPLISGHQLL